MLSDSGPSASEAKKNRLVQALLAFEKICCDLSTSLHCCSSTAFEKIFCDIHVVSEVLTISLNYCHENKAADCLQSLYNNHLKLRL